MDDPPPSPGIGSRHGGHKNSDRHNERHGTRPEGSRHGSDWLSKLHRRHDAKHHASRERQEDEEAPLLAQDDQSGSNAHDVAGRNLGSQARYYAQLPIQYGLGAAQKTARAAKNATQVAARGTSRAAKNGGRKVRNNPRTVMAIIIMILLLAIAVLVTLFGLHLVKDKNNKMSTTPSSIQAADNILQNLHPNAGAEGSSVDSMTSNAAAPDPCSEFDKLVCGGFEDYHEFRSDQGQVDAGKSTPVSLFQC